MSQRRRMRGIGEGHDRVSITPGKNELSASNRIFRCGGERGEEGCRLLIRADARWRRDFASGLATTYRGAWILARPWQSQSRV